MTDAPRPSAGRPRSPELDTAVLAATRELLVEVGYQRTSVRAIAARSKVSAPSIYRRWPTREQIIEDAIFHLDRPRTVQPSGDLRQDLLAWVELLLAHASDPASRSAIPGLLSAYQHDADAYRRLVGRGEPLAVEALRELVTGAYPDADVDSLYELLRGATFIRGLTRGTEDADAFCRRTTDSLLAVARAPRPSGP